MFRERSPSTMAMCGYVINKNLVLFRSPSTFLYTFFVTARSSSHLLLLLLLQSLSLIQNPPVKLNQWLKISCKMTVIKLIKREKKDIADRINWEMSKLSNKCIWITSTLMIEEEEEAIIADTRITKGPYNYI